MPVWWTWVGSTFYASRFDTDGLEDRVLTAVEMVVVAALAVNVHGVPHGSSAGFALWYAAMRGVLVVKYLRARRQAPDARPLTTRYALGFGIDAAAWFVSAFVPPPFRYALWVFGLLVSFGTPLSAGSLHGEFPPHEEHLPERFGLFTLIVLGESITTVVGGISGRAWTPASALVGVGSLVIAFSIWWLYFEHLDGAAIRAAQARGRTQAYQRWLYAHFPLIVGIPAAGIGVEHLLGVSHGVVPGPERWLVCGPLALCLFALGTIYRTADACADRDVRLPSLYRYATGVVVGVVGIVGGMMTPVVLVGVLAVVCVVPVVLDRRGEYDPIPGLERDG